MPNSSSALWFGANMIGFQLCWWSLVLYGNLAVPLALLLITIHLFFTPERQLDLKLILIVGILGFALDNVLAKASVWQFENSLLPAPIWLGCIWLCFGATLRHSFRPLWERKFLLPILGAFGGASSYIAANRLGAVSFGYELMVTGIICAFLWGVILPLIVWFAEREEMKLETVQEGQAEVAS